MHQVLIAPVAPLTAPSIAARPLDPLPRALPGTTRATGEARRLHTVVVTARRRSRDARQVRLSVLDVPQLQAIAPCLRDIAVPAAPAPSLKAGPSFARTLQRFRMERADNSDFGLDGSRPVP